MKSRYCCSQGDYDCAFLVDTEDGDTMGKKCSVGSLIGTYLNEQGDEIIASDDCCFHKMVICGDRDVEGVEMKAVNELFNLGWDMLHLGEKLRLATREKMKRHGDLDSGHLNRMAAMVRRSADELDRIATEHPSSQSKKCSLAGALPVGTRRKNDE